MTDIFFSHYSDALTSDIRESNKMFFDPGFTDVLRGALPGLGDFFLIMTQFGSELVFIGLLLILYWAVNKEEAILATYVLVTAILLNYWLKYVIAKERPPASNYYPGADFPNYSTPSGHSQFSATLYGWFAVRIRRWWVVIFAVVLTTLVGISRIYLGVHFLEDVLLGWGLGVLTIIAFVFLDKPAKAFLSRFRQEYLLLGLAAIGLLLALIASLLPEPPYDNFGSIGGMTIGLALGLALERRFVNFTIEPRNGQKWRLVLRVIIGLVIVVGLMVGLKVLFPLEDLWVRVFRYTLITLSGVFVWPVIFKKAGL
jgi:membrane-associated phospholipid phosphatase